MKKTIILGIVFILLVFEFVGCSNSKSPQMVNDFQLSLDGISSLSVSYDEETITFFESNSDNLVIKEYMTKNKKSYYAKVTERNDSIQIHEGDKPFFKDSFTRYIEVYLPKNYHQNLTVTSTNGDIDFTGVNLDISMLRIDSTSGNVILKNAVASDIHISSTSGTLDLGTMQANKIRLETTSGSITCAQLRGDVTYTSTNGNIDVKSAIGSGSYKTNNSGRLNVVYTEVNGNLSLFNKNDKITLTLPENLAFMFQATTKNGSIITTFQQDITVNGRTTSGIVGDNPTVTVTVETNNGDIRVTQ